MTKNTRKIITMLCTICIIGINTSIYAKYIFEKTFKVFTINIVSNNDKPQLREVNINNSNEYYPNYANHTSKINAKISICDNTNLYTELTSEDIEILINDKKIECEYKINNIELKEGILNIEVEITNINENGNLYIKILKDKIKNEYNNYNDEIVANTNVLIDNTCPTAEVIEEEIDKKSLIKIKSNENIRNESNWNISEDKTIISKSFPSNIKYYKTIYDFAGNETNVKIDVTKAKFINLIYSSYNANMGWKNNYASGEIAGKEAMQKSLSNRLESLLVSYSGEVNDEFIKASAYIYCYWRKYNGRCITTNNIYWYANNPFLTIGEKWRGLKSEYTITIENIKYFQLGGSGMNKAGTYDIYNKESLPEEAVVNSPYGISKIKMKLSNYEEYSIIYQLLKENKGWIECGKNSSYTGIENTNTATCFRAAVIPSDELKYVEKYWNSFINTYKLDEEEAK